MIYARRAEASVTVCLMHRSSPEPREPSPASHRPTRRRSFADYAASIAESARLFPPIVAGNVVDSKKKKKKKKGNAERKFEEPVTAVGSEREGEREKEGGKARRGERRRRRRPDANSTTTTMVTFYGSESSIACRSRSERQ